MKYKFRAYNKETGKMILLDPLQWPLRVLDEEEKWKVMMFTGLLDRHGKEIYEGDILKWTNHTKCCNVATWDCLCEVVWESCGFYRRDILDGTLYGWANVKNEQVEVIGNIYEHPELL